MALTCTITKIKQEAPSGSIDLFTGVMEVYDEDSVCYWRETARAQFSPGSYDYEDVSDQLLSVLSKKWDDFQDSQSTLLANVVSDLETNFTTYINA